ncbi:MAG: hypothetical protein QXF13_05020 [Thermoproteota archaeon]
MPRTQAEGAIFIQVGPDEGFKYLASSGLDDITVPAGDVELRYVPGPDYGTWVPVGLTQSPPGAVTTTVNFYLESTRTGLLRTRCPLNLRVNFSCAGPRSDVTNYMSAVILTDARITSRRISAPVSLEQTSNFVMANCEISAARAVLWGPPIVRQLYAEPIVAAVAEPQSCATECAPGAEHLERIHALTSDAYTFTSDGGLSWSEIPLPQGVTGTAIGAYGRVFIGGADDNGALVTYVEGGTIAAPTRLDGSQVVGFAQTLDGRVWLATTTRIYVTPDRGVSWRAMWSTTSGESIRDIRSTSNRVYAVTTARLVYGPPFRMVSAPGDTCDVNWGERVYIVRSGQLYRVYAGEVVNLGAFQLTSPVIRFGPERLFGIAVSSEGAAITEDGGVSWRALPGVSGTALSVVEGPAWLVAGESGLYVVEPGEEA